jgi:hypothetical protein
MWVIEGLNYVRNEEKIVTFRKKIKSKGGNNSGNSQVTVLNLLTYNFSYDKKHKLQGIFINFRDSYFLYFEV